MKLKTLLTALILGVLSLTSALGQYQVNETSLNGGTANVAATTTNSVTTPLFTVKRAQNVAIQSTFKLTGAGTSSVVFTLDSSVDASNWVTGTHSLSVTPSGTSVVSGILKIDTGGVGYFRLSAIANPNSAAVTNLVMKYSFKPGQ